MPKIGGFLSALGRGFQGYAMDQDNRMQRSLQQSTLDERKRTADSAANIQRTFRDNYKAAVAGDVDAQTRIVSVLPDAHSMFPRAAKPNRTYDSTRGVIVDVDAGRASSVAELPERPETPRAPQYDPERGGFVAPGQPFQPVAGLPPKPEKPKEPTGSFVQMATPEGKPAFFNPTTGDRRDPPADLRPIGGAGADYTKRVQALANTDSALKRLESTLTQYGTMIQPSAERDVLKSDYENLQLQLKELYNLGVLAGPDLVLMRSILSDPTSARGRIAARGSSEEHQRRIMAQVQSVRSKLEDFRKNLSAGNQAIGGDTTTSYSPDNPFKP